MLKKIGISILLIFNGLFALYGGWGLLTDASGKGMGLSVDLLVRSPFADYFIPGLILFTVLGLGSIMVFFLVLGKNRYYTYFVVAEGGAIIIWLLAELAMVSEHNILQAIFGVIGILLVILGVLEWKNTRNSAA